MVLNGGEEGLELEAGEHDDLVAAVSTGVRDDNQRVDVAKGQQTQRHLRIHTHLLTRINLMRSDLHGVRDDVAM